jgi:hypothetical protein
MLKRLFRRLKRNRYLRDHRRISDYRATAMAVRMVCTGALRRLA